MRERQAGDSEIVVTEEMELAGADIIITREMALAGWLAFHQDRSFETNWETVARIYCAMAAKAENIDCS